MGCHPLIFGFRLESEIHSCRSAGPSSIMPEKTSLEEAQGGERTPKARGVADDLQREGGRGVDVGAPYLASILADCQLALSIKRRED